MMRYQKSLLSAALIALIMGLSSGAAMAESKFLGSWGQDHWADLTFKPYLEKPIHPQNTQWDNKSWEPADWAAQRPNGSLQVINGFYRAEILHRQYVDDDIPVLEVGPNFYALSGYDKRRVMRMVDDYYKITTDHENGMFTLTDWRTHKPIGLYTAEGLQLQ